MEIEESDIFEITDYTNVTDWEKFISKVEEIITLIDNSQFVDVSVKKEIYKINFDKYELNITLFEPNIKYLEESQNSSGDCNLIEIPESLIIKANIKNPVETESDIHWDLVKWFGKRKFIVFSPSKSTSIYGQDQISKLISSITVAAVNIKCQLPIIVKYGPRNWPVYLGIQLENDLKYNLQCVIIKYTPKQFVNLSGIRRVFQEKLGKGYVFDDDVIISAKYIYLIENCSHNNENYFKGFIKPMKSRMHFFQYMSIGFGKDPIKNIKVVAHWSKVPKHVLIHSDSDSLPLTTASGWYMMCESENSYDGILFRSLRKLLKSFLVAQSSGEILLEQKPQDIDTMHINQPLLKLTNFPISNHHLFEKSFGNSSTSGNINKTTGTNRNELIDGKILQEILLFIFPDAKQNKECSVQQPYKISSGLNLPNYKKLQQKYPNFNVNSLIHRIAICLTNLLNNHKEGMKCYSYIWMEVVLELRYRWENSLPLPNTRMDPDFKLLDDASAENKDEIYARFLAESIPYLGSSQLEQRIQLINYCILTRMRNNYMKGYDNPSDNSDSDETEQFFDCETDKDTDLLSSYTSTKSIPEARGRLRKCGDLYLLHHPEIPLYIPVTQVHSVDIYSKPQQAKHDQSIEYLENYHAASLKADMSAFKSANPGCVIEDFIRWYSPKDFIALENSPDENNETVCAMKGELSSRMLVANNSWLNSWQEAIPIPARLQKRLFNETNAAETALKWMENLKSAEISSCLINNVLIDSLNAIVECVDQHDSPEILHQIDSTAVALLKFFDEVDVMDVTGSELEYYQTYDNLISHFQQLEYAFSVKQSLYHKFLSDYSGPDSDKEGILSMINHLLVSDNEVGIAKPHLPGSTHVYILNRLMSMYKISNAVDKKEISSDIDQVFTETYQKEYILSLNCPYPFPTSRASNQRLYICSNDNEFLMATNFCDDITYF